MIYPRKNRFLDRLFTAGLRRVMRRRFYAVFVRGLPNLQAAGAPGHPDPLVLCANHTNWWDGFAIALLSPLMPGRNLYLMQWETLLRRYAPLRYLGVFGLDIDGSPLPGLRFALKLLRDARNGVWIFPQGVLVPQWAPISIKPGALWLARKSGARILPVVFRYEWMVESRPTLFVNCGEPMPPESSNEELQERMRQLYDEIGQTLVPVDLTPYQPLFTPRLSMNKLWDWVRRVDGGNFNPRNE